MTNILHTARIENINVMLLCSDENEHGELHSWFNFFVSDSLSYIIRPNNKGNNKIMIEPRIKLNLVMAYVNRKKF